MPQYFVVLPVEEMPVGKVYRANEGLPLHCTLIPWFDTALSAPELGALIDGLEYLFEGVVLQSLSPALFGPDENVPVHVLWEHRGLFALHTKLLDDLKEKGITLKEPCWVGTRYRPHVTTVEGREFSPGTGCRPRKIVLVERRDDKIMIVVGAYDLEQPDTGY